MSRTVQVLRFQPVCKLPTQPASASQRLVENTRPLGQRQRTVCCLQQQQQPKYQHLSHFSRSSFHGVMQQELTDTYRARLLLVQTKKPTLPKFCLKGDIISTKTSLQRQSEQKAINTSTHKTLDMKKQDRKIMHHLLTELIVIFVQNTWLLLIDQSHKNDSDNLATKATRKVAQPYKEQDSG